MIGTNEEQNEPWDRGWREHKIRQLVRLAHLPFMEKLSWLEDAQILADALGAARKKPPSDILIVGSESPVPQCADRPSGGGRPADPNTPH